MTSESKEKRGKTNSEKKDEQSKSCRQDSKPLRSRNDTDKRHYVPKQPYQNRRNNFHHSHQKQRRRVPSFEPKVRNEKRSDYYLSSYGRRFPEVRDYQSYTRFQPRRDRFEYDTERDYYDRFYYPSSYTTDRHRYESSPSLHRFRQFDRYNVDISNRFDVLGN